MEMEGVGDRGVLFQ
ncbi:unnamed protein product, partial [Rotaria magnacalcarata]